MNNNLDMKKEFDFLGDFIKQKIKGKKVYYLANSGNYGDGLIREGTINFLKDYAIDYEEVISTNFFWKYFLLKKNSLFLYGGGGGWCKNFYHSFNIVKKISKKNEVIVLPSSYEKNYGEIKGVSFFSRDKFNSLTNMPNSIFCHDMAFYLGKIESKNKNLKKNGYFYRTDNESAKKIEIPESNLDVSLLGNHLSDINIFIDEIDKFENVYTDRLHVSIAATLLGKKVYLYKGSYFKNYDIYRSSMDPYFKNIEFVN